jgi:hypothetical protein
MSTKLSNLIKFMKPISLVKPLLKRHSWKKRKRKNCFTYTWPNRSLEASLLLSIVLELLNTMIVGTSIASLGYPKLHNNLKWVKKTSRK